MNFDMSDSPPELPNYKTVRILAEGVGCDAVAQRAAVDGAAGAEFDRDVETPFQITAESDHALKA